MLTRRIRNFALTSVAIVSAIVLTALGAPSASASTRPTCSANGTYEGITTPEACVQVLGSGLVITTWKGWAYNNVSVGWGQPMHIELYYNRYNAASPTAANSIPEHNCNGFYIGGHMNSPNCFWPGASATRTVNQGYYCSALWYYQGASFLGYADFNWKCVYVHS